MTNSIARNHVIVFFLLLSLLSVRLTVAAEASPSANAPVPRESDKPQDPVIDEKGIHYAAKVTYLRLSNKGLDGKNIAARPVVKDFSFPRPRPLAEFAVPGGNVGKNAQGFKPFEIELLEEAGAPRDALVRVGTPFPSAALYTANAIQVRKPGDVVVPCQTAVTEFWPDRSVRWALLQFVAPLKANEKVNYSVHYVPQAAPPTGPGIVVEDKENTIRIDTGKINVDVDKNRFNFFRNVLVSGKLVGAVSDDGLAGLTEDGRKFSSAAIKPRRVVFEERGPEIIVVRVDGSCGYEDGSPSFLDYTARLRFVRNSARVQVDLTLINVGLEKEFSDFRNLTLSFRPLGAISEFRGGVYDQKLTTYGNKSGVAVKDWTVPVPGKVMQQSDQLYSRGDSSAEPGKLASGVLVKTDKGDLALAVRDLWKRWPKGFSADKDAVFLDLLPPLPSAEFGLDLPFYLAFPFCEGFHRSKWGMSFTESLFFDFAPEGTAAVQAEADFPVVAVVDRDWYAFSDVVQGVIPKADTSFDGWDEWRVKGFAQHMALKEKQREYGYLNYGDWYGERGRNWGNNEYDTARSLFDTFARTGNRDMQRLAVATAIHQADVDILHANPDLSVVGGQMTHAIGHSGRPALIPSEGFPAGVLGTWSGQPAAFASNGHTWSGGLLDAWRFVGSARTRDASLELAEHITWSMTRAFTSIRTSERSAGWALLAISQIAESTQDPAYVEAAGKIFEVPKKEQNFEKGGGWPHPLPRGHAGDLQDTFGSAVFMVGSLSLGIRKYHILTDDPDAKKSLEAACGWLSITRQKDKGEWPYTASWDGKVYLPGNGWAVYLSPALIYAARLCDRKDYYESATEGLKAAFKTKPNIAFGKSFAASGEFVGDMMQELKKWQEKTGEVFVPE